MLVAWFRSMLVKRRKVIIATTWCEERMHSSIVIHNLLKGAWEFVKDGEAATAGSFAAAGRLIKVSNTTRREIKAFKIFGNGM